jgi:hypothetical protein
MLFTIGIKPIPHEPCVFIGFIEECKVIISLYVDDGLVLCQHKTILDLVMTKIAKCFTITRGPPTKYVGLEIHREGDIGPITIMQHQYVHDLLEKYNMEDCHPTSVPLQPEVKLVPGKEIDKRYPFRELIGSLIFLSKCSRPDISFAVSRLAQFMQGYDESHWKAAKYVLRYLKGTSAMGITYPNCHELKLLGYTDADYAGDHVTRKSTTGAIMLLNSSLISWTSQRQPCVALSSTESEYIAIATGARELIWLRELLKDLGFPQKQPSLLLVDNQSSIRLAKNPEMHSRTKHIDVRFHYVRELVQNEPIVIEYFHTKDQLADCSTKPLQRRCFKIFVPELDFKQRRLLSVFSLYQPNPRKYVQRQ